MSYHINDTEQESKKQYNNIVKRMITLSFFCKTVKVLIQYKKIDYIRNE